VLKYIQLLLLPINQNVDYDFPISNSLFDPRTILSLLALLVLVGVAIKLFTTQRLISFGIFWFLATLSIESSIIPISDVIFEHRTYLPSFGFCIVLVSTLHHYFGENRQKLFMVTFAGIVAGYALLTINRNLVWKTPTTLWSDVIKKSPNKARGYNNRGIMYNESKSYDLALNDFNKAIALQPTGFDPCRSLQQPRIIASSSAAISTSLGRLRQGHPVTANLLQRIFQPRHLVRNAQSLE
jgi:tetratricopeptide (TPR) repeat protein